MIKGLIILSFKNNSNNSMSKIELNNVTNIIL